MSSPGTDTVHVYCAVGGAAASAVCRTPGRTHDVHLKGSDMGNREREGGPQADNLTERGTEVEADSSGSTSRRSCNLTADSRRWGRGR